MGRAFSIEEPPGARAFQPAGSRNRKAVRPEVDGESVFNRGTTGLESPVPPAGGGAPIWVFRLCPRARARQGGWTMMLVKTRVAPSGIHGNGLFAAEPIPAGTPIWRFAAGFDQEFTPAFWSGLPELADRKSTRLNSSHT